MYSKRWNRGYTVDSDPRLEAARPCRTFLGLRQPETAKLVLIKRPTSSKSSSKRLLKVASDPSGGLVRGLLLIVLALAQTLEILDLTTVPSGTEAFTLEHGAGRLGSIPAIGSIP